MSMDRPYLARIDSIYAVLSTDAGGEGVISFRHGGTWIPMIAADETRLAELMPHAHAFATLNKVKVRLVRFTTREDIKEITP